MNSSLSEIRTHDHMERLTDNDRRAAWSNGCHNQSVCRPTKKNTTAEELDSQYVEPSVQYRNRPGSPPGMDTRPKTLLAGYRQDQGIGPGQARPKR